MSPNKSTESHFTGLGCLISARLSIVQWGPTQGVGSLALDLNTVSGQGMVFLGDPSHIL